jgi:GDP-L-fucose synthase
MDQASRIYVAGHRGMVGSACVRLLRQRGYTHILTRTRQELNLGDAQAVRAFYAETRPEYVIDAAAKVGGIVANHSEPVEFLVENLAIQNNLICGAHEAGVKKLLFLGSSCIYPKFAPQPIAEESLLTGLLEPTNEPYALAKICGIKLCEAYRRQYGANFISAMPTNLYGPEDNFDLTSSHVLPALLRKFHEAKERGDATVTLWGSGTPRREFLYVDDLAEACLFLLESYDGAEFVNVGCGEDIAIAELASQIRTLVGFGGEIVWDSSKPDGTPRKLLNVDRLRRLGWVARVPLEEGLRRSYEWWLAHRSA